MGDLVQEILATGGEPKRMIELIKRREARRQRREALRQVFRIALLCAAFAAIGVGVPALLTRVF
jgi:hypothetical protein